MRALLAWIWSWLGRLLAATKRRAGGDPAAADPDGPRTYPPRPRRNLGPPPPRRPLGPPPVARGSLETRSAPPVSSTPALSASPAEPEPPGRPRVLEDPTIVTGRRPSMKPRVGPYRPPEEPS